MLGTCDGACLAPRPLGTRPALPGNWAAGWAERGPGRSGRGWCPWGGQRGSDGRVLACLGAFPVRPQRPGDRLGRRKAGSNEKGQRGARDGRVGRRAPLGTRTELVLETAVVESYRLPRTRS